MSNVLAVGGRAPALTANPNAPAPCLPAKPPSPTAVAINLLNVLKIANTMSHPMYNPFAPGKQIPPQGPYGGQRERDPLRSPPQLGPGSGFSSSGSSSFNRGPSGGPIPSLLSLPVNYRPERNTITVDEDIDRCLDLHISRARGEAMQTSSSQNTHFTSVQRDTFSSSNTGMPSYLTPPATQAKRPFAVDSSSNSLDWLPICQRASEEASKKYTSPSSSFLGSGDGLFGTSSEGKHNMTSIPGLGDYEMTMPAKSAPPPEAVRPKYTSESASNILLHFGLEKEDLEHLISYPEDQITPENLPFILRQIQLEKGKRASTAAQSKPYGATQPIRSVGEKDSLNTPRGPAMNQGQATPTVLKPSKVIEYGHTGKYNTGVGTNVGRASGSSAMTGASGGLLRADSFKPSGHLREPPERGQGEPKTGPPVPSHSQMSSASGFGSSRSSVAPSSSDPFRKPGVQANQSPKSVFPSFGLLNKDTDLRRLKSEVPRAPPPKQPEPARQAPPQTQPSNPSCNLIRGVHPGRPGLVLIHRNDSHNSNRSNTQGQGLRAPEQANKLPGQQQQVPLTPPPQKPPLRTPLQPLQPIRPLKQVEQPAQPQGLPGAIPPLLGLFPVRPTPAPGRMGVAPRGPPPAFKDNTPVKKMGTSKLPTSAMMQDYAAATPRMFPHTCCLCMKECTDIKDWISHQNTSLHLESCRLLRGRYPDWDGKTLELLSGPGNSTQPSVATLCQNLQNRHQKSIHETRSHSLSPHRQRGSEDRKEKRFSRSRSRSPQHHYGSDSRRQKRSSRSRSRSPYRHHASEGQRERRSSRSPHTSRHSRRSRSHSYDRPTSSRHRSRSRSYERRSSPRKREAQRSSPRRSYEHRSSPRGSHDRRSPAERSVPQRKRSRSADRLAKRLLETSAVQSLSQQSDLEAMVKTLAPALLAELAKMKSSSSSNTEKKTSSSKSAKSETSSSPKPTSTDPLPPDKVRLCSVYSSLSHNDMLDAMEKFGKVRDVFIVRSTLQAVVHFEKEEDAEKLKSLRCFQVKGLTVYVDKKTDVASKKPQSTNEQKSASQTKSAESSSKSTPTGKDIMQKLSGAKNITTGKLVNKAKSVSTKQVAVKKSNAAGKSAVKSVGVETEGSVVPKPQSPEKMPDADDSKGKVTNTKPESDHGKSAEAVEVKKESHSTVGDEGKGEEIATEVKDLTPEAETQPHTVAVKDLLSKSAPSENRPVAAEAEGEQAPLVPENATENMDTEETSEKKRVEECVKVGDVEFGKTGLPEPMEVVTSQSKEKVSETLKPAKSHPAAGVKTPPCSSPPKASTDPRQTAQTPVQDEGLSVKDPSQVRPRTMEESEPPAEKLKTENEQQPSPKRAETKPKDVRSHPTPEPASNVLAVKLDEPTPADGAATAADVSAPTVKTKIEKQGQQEEIKCTPMETITSSWPPLSEDSNNEEQPTPQTCASVSSTPAVSAEPNQSDSVKAGSSVSDVKAGKNKSEVAGISTVPHKSNEKAEKKRLPRTPEKRTTPAPSTASVTALSTPEENAAELPHIDEDIFKALTTALREHRQRKGKKKISEEQATISKTTFESTKEEKTPFREDESKDEDNYLDPFDGFDFNFGDFVTVDEISEEMDDTAVEDASSSLEPMSSNITESQSTDASSARKTSMTSSKDGKSSASSSSKSEKGSMSLTSSSVSANKKKTSSEANKSETKTSSASTIKSSHSTPSESVEAPLSSGPKAQSNKRKPPVRSAEPSSSGLSTRSSAAASKSFVETTESAVANSDHQVSAESGASKSVESELRIKPSENNRPAEGQISQIQNLETDLKDETVKEMKKSKAEEKKKDSDGKSTEEKRSNNEKDQILDSLNEKSDEQKNKEDTQDRKIETQVPRPQKDQIFHQGGLQVVERADNDKARSNECHEMEIDESTKQQDIDPKDQTATADGGDHGTKEAMSPEASSVRATSDINQVTSEDVNQTQNNSGVSANAKQKDEIVLSEEVYETSKEVGQISNEEDHNDSKDPLRDQKVVVPTDLLSKADDESTEEEVYQVIDSVEDQPTATTIETESETEKKEQGKKESTTTSGDIRPTRQGRSRSRTSKSQEKEKSPKQRDKTFRKYATRTKESKTEEEDKSLEDFEEMVYEVVDSIEDDSVPETSTKESSGRRRPARGNKKDETSTHVEEPKKSDKEEEMFTVLDSVEEESPSDKPMVTRSTRGRKETTAKKVEENTKTKEDKTPPTRRRRTPVRDSQKTYGEKTPKTDIYVPLKESTPTKKSDARPLSEEETAYEVLDAVEEEVIEPTTQGSRRGRPKKDNKTRKKQAEELKKVDSPNKFVEEEATYQILDSVEDKVVDDLASVHQSEDARTLNVSADDDITAEMIRSLLNEEEDEPIYQIVDSLEEDQFPEETMMETSKKESETTGDMVASTDHVLSGPSTVEPPEQTGGEDKTQIRLQLAVTPLEDKEDPSPKGSDTEKKSTSKMDVGREDESFSSPNSHLCESEKKMLESPKRSDTKANKYVLVNLDQVSEEEEDYPDDAAEEEELKKKQAAANRREKDREEKKSRERETRERRSRSSSRGRRGKPTTEKEKASQGDLEKVEVDTQDLVTLDEVGEDEVGDEAPAEAPAWDGELTEGELQDLITLDEIAEEEEAKTEALPQSQESQSMDSIKPETMSAVTETAQTEGKKDENEDPKEPSSSSKRKHPDTTEESRNFVAVDEVGEIKEEEEKEAVRTRGRPRKRSRQTPVKKSSKCKTVKEEDYGEEEEENESLLPASLDSSSTPDTSGPSGDVQPESQRTEEEKSSEAASAEDQPQSEGPDGLKLGVEEVEQQELSRASVKVVVKRKQELTGPEAKQRSPSVPVDLQLPPFNPKNPLGKEFVNPTSGFFCSLCSVFYLNESTATEIHCSSQEHYDNLRNHYQRLQQGVQGSLSD